MSHKPHSHRHGMTHGRAQLSLIEHALCPLDMRESLERGSQFETRYQYTDKNRNRRTAHVRLAMVDGLSPCDDLYLWGLIGLALSQPEPSADFHATPYWCLRQMGLIDATKKGGAEFEQFRQGIRRLAGVRYENDAFYDSIRGEHREVRFGFLNYSLPLEQESSRTWRFAWDPIFFELCQANRSSLRFDLGLYRELSPASRRLYLLLRKIFWRNENSPAMEIRQLGVQVIGFSESLETKTIKQKLTRCLNELLDQRIIQLAPHQQSVKDCFTKQGKGRHTLQVSRGPDFDSSAKRLKATVEDSPLFDPLAAIGFDLKSIGRIIATYPARLIEQWADITLAARERKIIDTSPEAYFQYYIQRAAADQSTPPDWWRELQKQQRQAEADQQRAKFGSVSEDPEAEFDQYLKTEAKDAFERVMSRLISDFTKAGQDPVSAQRLAEHQAKLHLRNQYQQAHGHQDGWSKASRIIK